MICVRVRPGTEFDLLGLQTALIFQIMSDSQPAILGIAVFRNRQVNDQRIATVRVRQYLVKRGGSQAAEKRPIEMVGVQGAFSAVPRRPSACVPGGTFP